MLGRYSPRTLEIDSTGDRTHLTYAEAVGAEGESGDDWVCTLSLEEGLRIYSGDRLDRVHAQCVNARLKHADESHFLTEPAHLEFVPAN